MIPDHVGPKRGKIGCSVSRMHATADHTGQKRFMQMFLRFFLLGLNVS